MSLQTGPDKTESDGKVDCIDDLLVPLTPWLMTGKPLRRVLPEALLFSISFSTSSKRFVLCKTVYHGAKKVRVTFVLDILEKFDLLFDGRMAHVARQEDLACLSGFVDFDCHVLGGHDALVVGYSLVEIDLSARSST